MATNKKNGSFMDLKHTNNNNTNTSAVASSKKAITSPVVDGFKWLLGWVAANILPLVSFAALSALSVIGAMKLLGSMSHDMKLIISIIVVGTFAALSFGNKKS